MSNIRISLLVVVIILILFLATNKGIQDRVSRAIGYITKRDVSKLNSEPRLNQVLAPSFGKVAEIKTLPTGDIAIAIVLNLTDIHTQYVPIYGRVKAVVADDTGKYNIAMLLDKSAKNSKIITKLITDFGNMYIFQISGYITRYIDNYLIEGGLVSPKQLLGKIKFGSRVDIIIPAASYDANLRIYVKLGDHIKGAETVIAEYVKKV